MKCFGSLRYIIGKMFVNLIGRREGILIHGAEVAMNRGKNEILIWDPDRKRWGSGDSLSEQDRMALIREYTPTSVFPGAVDRTAGMVASLCPLEQLVETTPDQLQEMLSSICFEHKVSTPTDDDEYWLAQSPFNHKFYVFASCAFGGGWPTSPVYVLDERPAWFDED